MQRNKAGGTKPSESGKLVLAAGAVHDGKKKRPRKIAIRCRLLALPAELRNRIYELVIPRQTRISVCTWSPANSVSVQPALSRTCRQIRDETLPMYYEENSFSFISMCASSRDVLKNFTLGVHTKHVKQMKKIEIVTCHFKSGYCLDLSEGLANFEIKVLLRGSEYPRRGPRTLTYPRDGSTRDMPNSLYMGGGFLSDMVSEAERLGVVPVLHKAELKELMHLLHGSRHG